MKKPTYGQGRRVPKARHVPEKWFDAVKRRPPFRSYRIYPDYRRFEQVEVRIFRNRISMQAGWLKYEGYPWEQCDQDCMGRCVTYGAKIKGRGSRLIFRWTIARIYYNAVDLRDRPAEIMSHEAAHAAMGWARRCKANLSDMPGEEVMAHALGRLVAQANNCTRLYGVYKS